MPKAQDIKSGWATISKSEIKKLPSRVKSSVYKEILEEFLASTKEGVTKKGLTASQVTGLQTQKKNLKDKGKQVRIITHQEAPSSKGVYKGTYTVTLAREEA